VERFGNLPSTSQAALIMAVLSAFIIPIGALVAGEGLAILVLERPFGANPHEARWQEVEFTVTYRALFVRYLQRGLPDREAKLKALADVKGYLTSARPSGVRALSAGSGQTGQVNGQPADSMKNTLGRYLDEHAEAQQLSVNQLWERLQSEGIRVGRTSVAEVLVRQRHLRSIGKGDLGGEDRNDTCPKPSLEPFLIPSIDGLPGTESRRDLVPRQPDLHDEQHAFEQLAMSNSRTPGTRSNRKQGLNMLPARIGQAANAREEARGWIANGVERWRIRLPAGGMTAFGTGLMLATPG
jgi:hypothetical protein